MANWKDKWKTLYQTDSEWLRVKKDGTEPTLEVAEEIDTYEDEEGCEQRKYLLYRFEIARFKLENDPEDMKKVYLVNADYNPTNWPHDLSKYEEYDLASVARSVGESPLDLAKAFTSADPKVRVGAYMAVAGYHGLNNFDGYPLELNEPELDKRWG